MKLMFVFKIVLRGNSFTLVDLNEGILIGTLILVLLLLLSDLKKCLMVWFFYTNLIYFIFLDSLVNSIRMPT